MPNDKDNYFVQLVLSHCLKTHTHTHGWGGSIYWNAMFVFQDACINLGISVRFGVPLYNSLCLFPPKTAFFVGLGRVLEYPGIRSCNATT